MATRTASSTTKQKDTDMFWTIFIILLILGIVFGFTGIIGQLFWILIVVAIVVLIVGLVSGRRN